MEKDTFAIVQILFTYPKKKENKIYNPIRFIWILIKPTSLYLKYLYSITCVLYIQALEEYNPYSSNHDELLPTNQEKPEH